MYTRTPNTRIAIEYHGKAVPGFEGDKGKKHKLGMRAEQKEKNTSKTVSARPVAAIARPACLESINQPSQKTVFKTNPGHPARRQAESIVL